MSYFCKITSSWTPSNSLKKYLADKVKEVENKDVDTVEEVVAWLQGHVDYANRHFQRCTPEKLDTRKAHTKSDYHISCGVFQVTLYPKAGAFSPLAAPVPKAQRAITFDPAKAASLFA